MLKEKERIASEIKDMFMENMSHDFKTPLNGIYGAIQILNMLEDLTEKAKELVRIQEKSFLRLKNLVDSVLDFDKLSGGKVQLQQEDVNLLEIIESIVHNLSYKVKDKPVDIIIDYPPALPSHYISDSYCISSIILNLVNNAIKFTDKGQVIIRVALLSQQGENAQLKIEVEDTGIGISASKQDQIFERFHRLELSNKGLNLGHGIGLAAVKELLDRINGSIEVKSEEGKGSIFTAILPVKVQDFTFFVSK